MSENSKIEWTDHTFNPWEGCQKVGPGCDHCYAETRNARFAGGTAVNWGPGAPRRRTSPANWRKPLQWNRDGTFYALHGRRQRVFCASLADVFDNEVDLLWRRDLFRLIAETPNLDWLLLTKRIGNVPTMLRHIGVEQLPDNVWLGATVVNQAEADRDIPKLLAVPASVRFLSMEPLLGPVDLRLDWRNDIARWDDRGRDLPLRRIDWVIVGGESGPGARPMHPDWARSLRDQCAAADVPFLFKQWGEWIAEGVQMSTPLKRTPDPYRRRWVADDADDDRYTRTAAAVHPVGKKAAGRQLDGVTHDEFPRSHA
ncbi:phage Gp37/Gp68 family protein [Caballeronia sp. LZ033]|uniref:phage Gp37/Gp68 family protein n=1 Tax=Caballeronia sp. LZ033 TaxID=3038566 RepID=UPI0028598319|nr:phage Gp37/Gp68 family protein [Caballeronia sp. LZ033]MDR5815839.1 phage Gp37/Gp68 family protein [Caballeronia sp. LZ033]